MTDPSYHHPDRYFRVVSTDPGSFGDGMYIGVFNADVESTRFACKELFGSGRLFPVSFEEWHEQHYPEIHQPKPVPRDPIPDVF